MRKLIPTLLLVLLALPAWATDYYVRSDADAGGDGTTSATTGANCAWDAIADINAKNFSSGDVVNIRAGDTFNDATLTLAGISGAITSLTVQGGDFGEKTIEVDGKPLIDGDVRQPMDISNSNISNLLIKNIRADGDFAATKENHCRFENIAGLIIDGLDMDGSYGGYNVDEIGQTPLSIDDTVTGGKEVKNCTINGYGKADGAGSPIIAQSTTDSIAIYFGGPANGTIWIHSNVVYDMGADAVQIVAFDGTSIIIEHNEFYNCLENGVDLKGCSNAIIRYNNIYRTDAFTGGADCDHIVVHEVNLGADSWDDNIIEYNSFTENSTRDCTGISITGDADETITNTIVRGNFFQGLNIGMNIGNYQSGSQFYNNVFIGQFDSFVIYENSASAATYYNNTIDDAGNAPSSVAIYIANATSDVFTNNIFSWDSATHNIFTEVNGANDSVLTYNLYYNPSKSDFITWNGTNYGSTWGDWTTGHTGALKADPQLNSDGTLKMTSPAINAANSTINNTRCIPGRTFGVDGTQSLIGDTRNMGAHKTFNGSGM